MNCFPTASRFFSANCIPGVFGNDSENISELLPTVSRAGKQFGVDGASRDESRFLRENCRSNCIPIRLNCLPEAVRAPLRTVSRWGCIYYTPPNRIQFRVSGAQAGCWKQIRTLPPSGAVPASYTLSGRGS